MDIAKENQIKTEGKEVDLLTSKGKEGNDEPEVLHPLLEAIKTDKDDDVKLIEKVLDANPNGTDVKCPAFEVADGAGMTALMHAAWKGKSKIAKFLLDQVHLVICDKIENSF